MTTKAFQISPEPRLINAQQTDPATGVGKGSFSVFQGTSETEGAFVNSAGVRVQLTQDGKINAERNTVAFVGSGVSLFKEKSSAELRFKTLVAGQNIILTPGADSVTISSVDTGEANTATNEGTGLGVFLGKTGVNLRFKTLKAGANVTITDEGSDLLIAASGGGSGGSGESNTASNLGATGARVFVQKSGVDLQFRRLIAGSGMVITENANDITLVASAGSGEANVGTNVGSGTGEVYKQKTGTTLEMRRIQAGAGISIVTNTDEIVISSTVSGGSGEANTASNNGTGVGVFKQKTGVNLEFKSIKAGSNISVTQVGDDITIANLASGETNTASNLGVSGDGVGLFAQKSGVDLQFKRLKAGANITLTNESNDILIASAGGAPSNEFSFTLPAASTLAARISSVTGLPTGWSLATADTAAEGQFGSNVDTLVITWASGLGTKLAQDINVMQVTNSGPIATQGIQHLDTWSSAAKKTNLDRTKAAVYLSGAGIATTKDLVVYVKLI